MSDEHVEKALLETVSCIHPITQHCQICERDEEIDQLTKACEGYDKELSTFKKALRQKDVDLATLTGKGEDLCQNLGAAMIREDDYKKEIATLKKEIKKLEKYNSSLASMVLELGGKISGGGG